MNYWNRTSGRNLAKQMNQAGMSEMPIPSAEQLGFKKQKWGRSGHRGYFQGVEDRTPPSVGSVSSPPTADLPSIGPEAQPTLTSSNPRFGPRNPTNPRSVSQRGMRNRIPRQGRSKAFNRRRV